MVLLALGPEEDGEEEGEGEAGRGLAGGGRRAWASTSFR